MWACALHQPELRALIVYSATAGNSAQISAKTTLETIFKGNNVDIAYLDGSDAANHPRLRTLFEISKVRMCIHLCSLGCATYPRLHTLLQQRGKYPQVFKEPIPSDNAAADPDEEEMAQFVGLADEVIDLNDDGRIPDIFASLEF